MTTVYHTSESYLLLKKNNLYCNLNMDVFLMVYVKFISDNLRLVYLYMYLADIHYHISLLQLVILPTKFS